MTRDDMEIVSAIRSRLADRVGKSRFELWFGEDVELQFEEGVLHVRAVDTFRLERVRSRFRKELQAAAREVLGIEPPLEFAPLQTEPADPVTGHPSAGSPTTDRNEDLQQDPQQDTPPKEPRASSDRQQRKLPRVVGPLDPRSAGAQANRQERPPSAYRPARTNGRRETGTRGSAANGHGGLSAFSLGDCNRLAYTSAQMTASRLGRVSPLFFYGPHGCGKTHLLECLQRDVRGRLRSGRVVYLSAEQFTSLFLEALQGSGLPNFRRKYRDLDLLLIDDVQFFAGKRATLVELHHTIDSLSRTGRQLVFAADRSPIELTGLGPELTARMAGGLVCGMEAIDEPVRREIAARLCRERRFAVPEDVLDLMAARLPGDGRQLRGAVNRLEAMAVASGKAPSLESARETLEDLFGAAAPLVRITDIEEAVCSAFGLERSSLQSDRRSKAISQPRMLAMWLARKYTRAAYAEIGRYFGKRSHSTVISANKKVAQWVSEGVAVSMPNGDYKVRDALRRIESQLRTG